MKRWLRGLFIAAPVIVLLLGVPAGVALARRSPTSLPVLVAPGSFTGTVVPRGTPRPLPSGNSNGPFVGPRPLFGPPLPVSQATNGLAGVITRTATNRIIVYTKSKKIAFVEIDPQTTIRMNGKNIKLSQLERGDLVTVLGHRDREGAFHADLIRATRPAPSDPPPGAAR